MILTDDLQLPEHLEAQLKKIEKMRRDFVANVSHELRTPLTVIRGYLEAFLLQKERFDPVLIEVFQQMYQNSVRMENLVSGLLLLSRLESNKTAHDKQISLPVSVLIYALKLDAENISRDLGRNHRFHLEIDESLFLLGNEEELKSLFSNLMINAVRYTVETGDIQIRWFLNEAGQGIFEVQDTGIGIAEKHIPRLTERFYRVDKSRSEGHGSTGLGLAIVKHVLLRHDAELQIESELGRGSVFRCVFSASRLRHEKK
jgi:two-component system, OmpR family, phosphate regulon sensor histidine kinase PhoR